MPQDDKNNIQNYMYMKNQGIQDRNADKTYVYQEQHLDLLDDIYQLLLDTQKEAYAKKKDGKTPDWAVQASSQGGSKLDVAEQARLVRTRDKQNQEYQSAMLGGITNLNTTFEGKMDGLQKAMKRADYNPYKLLMNKLGSSLVQMLAKSGLGAILTKGGLKTAAVAAVAAGGYKFGGLIYDKFLKGPMDDWVNAYAEKENNLQRTQSMYMQSQIKKLNRLVELGEMSQGMAKEEISLERSRVAILEGMRMIGNLSDDEYLNALTEKDKYTIDYLKEVIAKKDLLEADIIESGVEERGREMIKHALGFVEKDRQDLINETKKFEEKKKKEEEKLRREQSIKMQIDRNAAGVKLFDRAKGGMSQQDMQNIGQGGLSSARDLFQTDYNELRGKSQQELVEYMYKFALKGAKGRVTQKAIENSRGMSGTKNFISQRITALEAKIAKRTSEGKTIYSRDKNTLMNYKQDLKDNAKTQKQLDDTIKRLTDLLESGKIGNNIVTSQSNKSYIVPGNGTPTKAKE